MPTVLISDPSVTHFTVPEGVTLLVAVRALGAGAPASVGTKGGGGGGSYANDVNLAVTPGDVIPLHIGDAAGAADTWFGGADFTSARVAAKGGNGQAGGDAAQNIGAVKFSGGNGGAQVISKLNLVDGGGGGAAGPNGPGRPGQQVMSYNGGRADNGNVQPGASGQYWADGTRTIGPGGGACGDLHPTGAGLNAGQFGAGGSVNHPPSGGALVIDY